MGSLEYYNRTTINSFIKLPISHYIGVSRLITNSGAIRNSGVEMTAGIQNKVGKIDWKININIAHNIGKVISGGTSKILYGSDVYGMKDWLIYDEGEDIGAIYGFKINGIISNEDNEIATTDGETAKLGAISYIDQNADGLIDNSDRVVLGSVTPNWLYGFSTDIESIKAPKGLNEDVIKFISNIKKEPQWMLDFRLKAYERLKLLKEPNWQKPKYPKIDYQDLYYYSAPKSFTEKPKNLEDLDPKLLETYKKLGIPLDEQKKLNGIAVDAVFDSVSVATTFKDTLTKHGIIFCSIRVFYEGQKMQLFSRPKPLALAGLF